MITETDDSSEDWDNNGEPEHPHGGRMIRMHCPSCSTMVELARRAPDITVIDLWDRMARRNKKIRVRCPACTMLVKLKRRKQWKLLALAQPNPKPSTTFAPSVPALEPNDRRSRQAPLLPESRSLADEHSPPRAPSFPESRSLAGQRSSPPAMSFPESQSLPAPQVGAEKSRPVPSPRQKRKRSQSWESEAPPSSSFVLAALFIAVVAVVLRSVAASSWFVATVSFLAAALAIWTLAVAIIARAPRRWPAVATALTMAVLFFVLFLPNGRRRKFDFEIQTNATPDFTFATPKPGALLADVPPPKDPNGVDASKFGLDRDWFHFQVNSVLVGPAEVRPVSDEGPSRTEPHLLIAVSYGSIRNSVKGTNPTKDQAKKLNVNLYDPSGRRYERQNLQLASPSAKVKSFGSYASGIIDETMIFAVPPGLEGDLRLEISVPPLGATPFTFTIPKSMISSQVASPLEKRATKPGMR
jgi:hypothetical protein